MTTDITSFPEDKAGTLKSEAHRMVLATLSLPEDEHAWTLDGVVQRVWPHLLSRGDVEALLEDLVKSRYAKRDRDGYKLTAAGLAKLTGPIANEPPPGAPNTGPALVVPATPIERVS